MTQPSQINSLATLNQIAQPKPRFTDWRVTREGTFEKIGIVGLIYEMVRGWLGLGYRTDRVAKEYALIRHVNTLGAEGLLNGGNVRLVHKAAHNLGITQGVIVDPASHKELATVIDLATSNTFKEMQKQQVGQQFALDFYQRNRHKLQPILDASALQQMQAISTSPKPTDKGAGAIQAEVIQTPVRPESSTETNPPVGKWLATLSKEAERSKVAPAENPSTQFETPASRVLKMGEGIESNEIASNEAFLATLTGQVGFQNAFTLLSTAFQLAHAGTLKGTQTERKRSENARGLFERILSKLATDYPKEYAAANLKAQALERSEIPTPNVIGRSRGMTVTTVITGAAAALGASLYALWQSAYETAAPIISTSGTDQTFSSDVPQMFTPLNSSGAPQTFSSLNKILWPILERIISEPVMLPEPPVEILNSTLAEASHEHLETLNPLTSYMRYIPSAIMGSVFVCGALMTAVCALGLFQRRRLAQLNSPGMTQKINELKSLVNELMDNHQNGIDIESVSDRYYEKLRFLKREGLSEIVLDLLPFMKTIHDNTLIQPQLKSLVLDPFTCALGLRYKEICRDYSHLESFTTFLNETDFDLENVIKFIKHPSSPSFNQPEIFGIIGLLNHKLERCMKSPGLDWVDSFCNLSTLLLQQHLETENEAFLTTLVQNIIDRSCARCDREVEDIEQKLRMLCTLANLNSSLKNVNRLPLRYDLVKLIEKTVSSREVWTTSNLSVISTLASSLKRHLNPEDDLHIQVIGKLNSIIPAAVPASSASAPARALGDRQPTTRIDEIASNLKIQGVSVDLVFPSFVDPGDKRWQVRDATLSRVFHFILTEISNLSEEVKSKLSEAQRELESNFGREESPVKLPNVRAAITSINEQFKDELFLQVVISQLKMSYSTKAEITNLISTSPSLSPPPDTILSLGSYLQVPVVGTCDENWKAQPNELKFLVLHAAAPNIGERANAEDFQEFSSNGRLNEDLYLRKMESIMSTCLEVQASTPGVKGGVWFPFGMGAFLRNLGKNDDTYKKDDKMQNLRDRIAERFVTAALKVKNKYPAFEIHYCQGWDETNQEVMGNFNAIVKAITSRKAPITLHLNADVIAIAQTLKDRYGSDFSVSVANGANKKRIGNHWYEDRANVAIDENLHRRSPFLALLALIFNRGFEAPKRQHLTETLSYFKEHSGSSMEPIALSAAAAPAAGDRGNVPALPPPVDAPALPTAKD